MRSLHARRGRALSCCALAALSLATTASATTAGRARWHFEVGPSLWLNTKVHYGANASADPSLAPRTDRFYDDGFNRVDASGNLGDGAAGPLASRTGFFGFTHDSQVDLRAGTLALHTLSAAQGAYLPSRRPDLQPGLDLNVRRSLARSTAGRDWGVEAGLDFVRQKHSANGAEAASLRLLTDTYPLGGVVPQRAPYSGRFSPLPGDQRIGDTPSRAIGPVAGTVTGTRSFSARTSVLRLGGWVELLASSAQPPSRELDRWSVLVRGGPALVTTRASFSVDEQLQAPGLGGSVRVTGDGTRRRSDLGAFAGLKVRREFGESSALVAWGDFLTGPKLSVPAGARYARIDLSSSVLVGIAFEVQWGRR